MSLSQDIIGVLRGLQAVAQSAMKLQEANWKIIWLNSNIKSLPGQYLSKTAQSSKIDINKPNENVVQMLIDSADRFVTVFDGIKQFAASSTQNVLNSEHMLKAEYISAPLKTEVAPVKNSELHIKLTPSEKALLQRLDMEHQERINASASSTVANTGGNSTKSEIPKSSKECTDKPSKSCQSRPNVEKVQTPKEQLNKPQIKAIPNPKSRQSLNEAAKERTVPSSRMARMFSFGSLAAGLGVGTAAEFVRRSLGVGTTPTSSSMLFLSPANMDRIVDTLCKVRGAALKIGQMLSIQDENTVNPELAKALERVRKSADFMPQWQVNQVLQAQFGETWRSNLQEFEEKPFAAASIGQVHWAKTKNGQEVAIKIQYPGVAKGITSDIDNLVGIMKVWDIFPSGLFIDNVVTVAKKELAWEVDYIREAQCTKRFKELLQPYPDFYVPHVIDDFCSAEVFTTEFVEGIPVDQCIHLDDEHRKFIANKIMELCLLELMQFRFMQTDPNWANFLYNPKTRKLVLLDFGASREYPKEFVDKYVRTIKAASENDRDAVLKASKEIGFLTGYEDRIMEAAHVDAVMILGEVFRTVGEYKFNGHELIHKVQHLLPTVIAHRLCPPPEEIYSLHRKLSGIFLLCAKLNTSMSCRDLFLDMYNNYKFDT